MVALVTQNQYRQPVLSCLTLNTYSFFINKLSCNCYAYVEDIKLSAPLEQLQNEKTRLEEARTLDEELKQLETRWKVLGEKVAIQELRNQNAAKQETINQLKSKISLLETQLEKLSTGRTIRKEETVESENAERQEANKEAVDAPEEKQEKDDDTIMVMALDNEEEISENFEAEQEKKKQGFFY
jgi:hypothetical protein